jgi:hypothetical protein
LTPQRKAGKNGQSAFVLGYARRGDGDCVYVTSVSHTSARGAGAGAGRGGLRSQRWSSATAEALTGTLLGAIACASTACTAFEPGTDTLPGDETAALQPGEDDPLWGCLTPTPAPPLVPVFSESGERIIFSLQLVDLSTGQIYPDATVRACGLADINCESPVVEGLTVDPRGWVDIPLYEGFTGFLEITSPSLLPYLFYLTEPVPGEPVREFPLGVITRAALQPLVALAGLPFEADTGLVAFRAFDCTGGVASGVSFVSETEGVPWYFVDGLPNTMVASTSPDGLFGLANAPPGLSVIDPRAPNGLSIAGPQSLVVRAGWLSAGYVRPRPAP